jgi:hypothetical protein
MKAGKPIEGIIDLILWIWLFPVMLTLYVLMIGKEVKS